ncbi:hypothetical protein C8R46DRAFT_498506 [Mycena filopes]|nr:hypothetical protein C8R46DRAFT_498506 [Mycena filopes]
MTHPTPLSRPGTQTHLYYYDRCFNSSLLATCYLPPPSLVSRPSTSPAVFLLLFSPFTFHFSIPPSLPLPPVTAPYTTTLLASFLSLSILVPVRSPSSRHPSTPHIILTTDRDSFLSGYHHCTHTLVVLLSALPTTVSWGRGRPECVWVGVELGCRCTSMFLVSGEKSSVYNRERVDQPLKGGAVRGGYGHFPDYVRLL